MLNRQNLRPIGAMVRILAYCARGRKFDSRTVQTFVCMHISVCIESGRFLCLYIETYILYVCIYKKKYISTCFYPFHRIYNISLVSAYYGLDKRECLENIIMKV
jgi:hypothetical protein